MLVVRDYLGLHLIEACEVFQGPVVIGQCITLLHVPEILSGKKLISLGKTEAPFHLGPRAENRRVAPFWKGEGQRGKASASSQKKKGAPQRHGDGVVDGHLNIPVGQKEEVNYRRKAP